MNIMGFNVQEQLPVTGGVDLPTCSISTLASEIEAALEGWFPLALEGDVLDSGTIEIQGEKIAWIKTNDAEINTPDIIVDAAYIDEDLLKALILAGIIPCTHCTECGAPTNGNPQCSYTCGLIANGADGIS